MQHMLTVNVLMALAFITGLSAQTGVLDATSLARSDETKVQGAITNENAEISEQRRQEIEAKRLEIEQKNAAKRSAITEKLSGKRAEQCVAKQEQINRMLDDRAEAAQRHYDTFSAILSRLETYATEQKLEIEYSNALEIIVPEAQDKALLAVQDLQTTDFDCTVADASAPGAIIKEKIASTKQALRDYRDVIKQYAEAVKSAADSTTEEVETSTESESQEKENE